MLDVRVQTGSLVEQLSQTILSSISTSALQFSVAATLALNQFQKKYTRVAINRSTLLQEEEDRMIEAKTKAWNDRFAAESDAYPPTFDHL
jgi:hypothetical protein